MGDSSAYGLGWVDLEFPGWWAATVATYCPSRLGEHPKSKSTQPRYLERRRTLFRVSNLLAHLEWVDLDFECSTVCPILPGLMVIWQKGLGSRARW